MYLLNYSIYLQQLSLAKLMMLVTTVVSSGISPNLSAEDQENMELIPKLISQIWVNLR